MPFWLKPVVWVTGMASSAELEAVKSELDPYLQAAKVEQDDAEDFLSWAYTPSDRLDASLTYLMRAYDPSNHRALG